MGATCTRLIILLEILVKGKGADRILFLPVGEHGVRQAVGCRNAEDSALRCILPVVCIEYEDKDMNSSYNAC
jgi:hypothetical protein